MQTLPGHRRVVRALAYAPGSAPLLASAGDDQTVRLWDLAVRGDPAVFESRFDGLLVLCFSPDGRFLAAGGRAGSLTVWDLHHREQRPTTVRCDGPVISLSFTPNGRTILAGLRSQRYGGEPGRLLCWNLSPPHPPQTLPWEGDVESVAIAPQRDLLAIAGQHRGVELWQVAKPRGEPCWWLPARVRNLQFSPGPARRLAVASGRLIQLYDVETKQPTAVCTGHRAEVLTLAFSPDGTRLISGGPDRSVRVWDALSGRELAACDWQVGTIHATAFSPDGMTGACAGDKGAVVVWDVDL